MSGLKFGRTAAIALVLVLAACGSALMGGGIAGTSSVTAPITGFGSIFVAGIEFDTTDATVTIEGDAAQISELKLGMLAAVKGAVNSARARGTAQQIAVEHVLQGPVDAVDVATGMLTAFGQRVATDASTVFDPEPIGDLRPGERVEIAGFFVAAGTIRATRVERVSDNAELSVEGFVRELDAEAGSFRLGSLSVQFGSAAVTGALDGLSDGTLVEVAADALPVAGVLVASDVEVVNPLLAPDEGEGLKVEGFVTRILSPTELVIGGKQQVELQATTRFVHGTADGLALDAFVDVEGVADADGTLVASKVDFGTGQAAAVASAATAIR